MRSTKRIFVLLRSWWRGKPLRPLCLLIDWCKSRLHTLSFAASTIINSALAELIRSGQFDCHPVCLCVCVCAGSLQSNQPPISLKLCVKQSLMSHDIRLTFLSFISCVFRFFSLISCDGEESYITWKTAVWCTGSILSPGIATLWSLLNALWAH